MNIRLVTSRHIANKLAMKPNFDKNTIFFENLIVVHMKKTQLELDKPVNLGASILDISKTWMYDFHYDYVKKNYGPKSNLLFTDTDSPCYELETQDFYKDISGDVERLFDTSNYPKDHLSKIPTGKNKKFIGMFKDEAGGKIIQGFVGLRAKLYVYKMLDRKEEKKCKGIRMPVIKKDISFEDYKECLFSGCEQMRKMNIIRSQRHTLYTEEVNKVAMSARVYTLAIGHYKTI